MNLSSESQLKQPVEILAPSNDCSRAITTNTKSIFCVKPRINIIVQSFFCDFFSKLTDSLENVEWSSLNRSKQILIVHNIKNNLPFNDVIVKINHII